jgi:hypothetical protein
MMKFSHLYNIRNENIHINVFSEKVSCGFLFDNINPMCEWGKVNCDGT